MGAAYAKCAACVVPENCQVLGACVNAAHYADLYRAQLQALRQGTPMANAHIPQEVKRKDLTTKARAVTIHPSTPQRRKDPQMNTAQQIAADLEFAKENEQEFIGYDGRVATTKIIRYVAALNADVTKAEFVRIMADLGFNKNTVGIQFAQSRKDSLECGDVRLLPDGRLVDL